MKWKFFILLAVYTNILLTQNIVVKDSLLKTPIENVSFYFQQTGTVSDKNGLVNISAFNENDNVKISHIAYFTKNITKKNIGSVIYLMPKTTILPTINLVEEIKTPISKKYPVFKIKPQNINRLQATIGEVLSSESSIVIQESQSGAEAQTTGGWRQIVCC